MRKVVVGAFLSLDGIMQSPGGQTKIPSEASARRLSSLISTRTVELVGA